MDYAKCSVEELERLSEKAFSDYYALAVEPCGDWSKGKSFKTLEAATKALNAINDEIERRASRCNIGSEEAFYVVRDGDILFFGTENDCNAMIEKDMTGLLEVYPASARIVY